MAHNRSITGVILAGGQARRMGGVDKGQVLFRGKPLVEHVIERIVEQVDDIIISANREQQRYSKLGYRVVADALENFQGPLAGLQAAARYAQSEYMLVVACDMPQLPGDLVDRLMQALVASEANVAVAHDGEREQIAAFLIAANCAMRLEQYLQAGDRKLSLWLHQQQLVTVDFSDKPQAFANLNTLEELAALE